MKLKCLKIKFSIFNEVIKIFLVMYIPEWELHLKGEKWHIWKVLSTEEEAEKEVERMKIRSPKHRYLIALVKDYKEGSCEEIEDFLLERN